MPTQLKEILTGVVVIIGMLAGAWVYIDGKYARAEAVKKLEAEAVVTFKDLRRNLVAEELNYIYEKKSHETYASPPWEKSREQKLQLQWESLAK